MLTKALAVDHAAENIRVNAIAPGPTDTPMLRGLMDEAERQAFGASLPIKRLGKPEEIAAAALFLASDEAAFVTGAVLEVDGGQTALVQSKAATVLKPKISARSTPYSRFFPGAGV